jgi:hypothetical protein
MNNQKSKLQRSKPEFVEFWKNFRLSHWKWIDKLASHSKYLVSAVLFMYAVVAYLTFFPENKWVAPLQITDPHLIYKLGGDTVILPLKHYGSINIIFLAMILIFVLLIRWHHQIPVLFQWLWENGRLELQDGDLRIEFEQYLQDYQRALLSRKEPLIISFFLLLGFVAIGLWAGIPQFLTSHFTPLAVVVLTILVLMGLLCLFMAGPAGWIGFVTGRQIGKLPHKFSIKIQPRHSDKCGGLKPLGNFSFDAALPLIGGGLILATVPILHLDIDDVLSIMSASIIFAFFAPLTIMAVFTPLWQFHVVMTEQKMIYEDAFASQAMGLERIIRDHTTEDGDLTRAETAKEKLEILQTVNPEKTPYPVWPFRFTSTVLAVFSPQILQAITGIIAKAYEFF